MDSTPVELDCLALCVGAIQNFILKNESIQALPCVRLFQVPVILGLGDDHLARRSGRCPTVAARRVLMTRNLAYRESGLLVDLSLGAGHTAMLAPASGITLRVLLCPHHKSTRVKKELLRRPEGAGSFRS